MLRRLANHLFIDGYFKLLSVACSSDLRRKLDCAMYISDHPSPEVYAQISPRYDSQRPMRLEDGRCALNAELGMACRSQYAVCIPVP